MFLHKMNILEMIKLEFFKDMDYISFENSQCVIFKIIALIKIFL